MKPPPPYLVWMDLEMTGLDPVVNTIIEIATLITDNELNVVAEGPVLAVRTTEAQLAAMDDWNTSHHTASGLVDRIRNDSVSLAEAERQTLAFMQEWVGERDSPLCGNTIGQDRRFLVRYMPLVEAHLHYRSIDVSTLKELARRWKPSILGGFRKQATHRALDDIRESVAELRYYREHFLR